ncbi:hypothetical protein PCNPT3_00670 [Psychromonas sp. CNPT3]|uniref:DUF494 domain-containing protein n=1 Tax=Psychromonas sp. CNPT3 TaxID=314282 RepID=UPI00006E70AF|nr:DUF494 domain-containing protein [Psychromonas sp. CNPT3]AGH80076.1 hypothetical protein PCNPT3_00670 [Psychromonas sp. CNPT3]
MFEVIIYLFESYMQLDQSVDVDAEEITEELLGEGFSDDEISKALAWLDNLTTLHEKKVKYPTLQARDSSYRIYNDMEKMHVNCEAQGYISYLEQAKIINTHSREIVIESIISLEMPDLSLQNLKWLILMVLFNDPESSDAFLQLESMLLDFQDGLIH